MINLKIFFSFFVVCIFFYSIAFSGYEKVAQTTFTAHGTWQKVTITTQPNIFTDSYGVSITGYAVFEETGILQLEVCEGNTYNASAAFLVVPPGVPRITNIHNPLVHQEGLNIRVPSGTATDVSVETWIKFY